MSKARISRKPTVLRDQMMEAATAIGAEADWPATAPPQAQVNTEANELHAAITAVDAAEAQLANLRADLHAKRDTAYATMRRIDEVTDGLYGSDGTQKNAYGLPPKKSTAGASVPLGQPVILKLRDGVSPASIFVDWDTIEGAAAYHVEWFINSSMTGSPTGSVAVSESEYEISGLQPKQQYWIRIRAVRGSGFGQWSDPATRVANL